MKYMYKTMEFQLNPVEHYGILLRLMSVDDYSRLVSELDGSFIRAATGLTLTDEDVADIRNSELFGLLKAQGRYDELLYNASVSWNQNQAIKDIKQELTDTQLALVEVFELKAGGDV